MAEPDESIERRLPLNAPRGPTEITLIWDGFADVDLIVERPDGQRLWHANPIACGGRLLDDINFRSKMTPTPVQHVAWAELPPGTYKIFVELFSYNTATPGDIPCQIRIKTPAGERTIDDLHIEGIHKSVLVYTVTF